MSSLRINARSIGAPVALGAVVLVIGAVNARAGNDDAGTFSAIGAAIGISSGDGQTIDYRERPKLVVPPDRTSLPEPNAAGGARPPSFPVDQGSARRQGARAVSSQSPSADEPSRENLTQPPYGYRHPSKDLSLVKDSSKKQSNWWNPMSYLGSKDSPTPSSSGAAPQPASGALQPAAAKQETSWWNPMGYLPAFGSK